MFNRYLTYYSAATQFVIFCALLSMGFLIGGFFFESSVSRFLNIKGEDVQQLTNIKPAMAATLRWILPVSNFLILFVPALVFSYLAYPKPTEYLGVKKKNLPIFITLALLWFVCSLPFSSWLERWNALLPWVQQFEKSSDHLDQLGTSMLNLHSSGDLLLNLFFIALLPAIIEEVFFRGCLQQLLLNWLKGKEYLVIVLVALIFSAFHMQMSAFLPRFFLGLLLGLTYFWSANLWNSILIHFINNALIVVLFNLQQRGKIHINLQQLPDVPWFFALGSLLFSIAIGLWFYKKKLSFNVYQLKEEEPA
ncbi:MAG: CPBP family intramembrane metalloprotease [Chitinophagaceae bacterium]|nr:CPBP family intramembrane metalloprotease [Chitinophagaceae bacterium]